MRTKFKSFEEKKNYRRRDSIPRLSDPSLRSPTYLTRDSTLIGFVSKVLDSIGSGPGPSPMSAQSSSDVKECQSRCTSKKLLPKKTKLLILSALFLFLFLSPESLRGFEKPKIKIISERETETAAWDRNFCRYSSRKLYEARLSFYYQAPLSKQC